MITLPGYALETLLYEGRRSRIYRGFRDEDGQPVVVKLPRETAEVASRSLLHELTLGQSIDHHHVVRYFEILAHDEQWALVAEDFGALGLDQLLPAAGLPLDVFLDLAVQVSSGLAAIHAEGVVHKDIKPSNLAWNREQALVKIIDFGIASRLREERHKALGPSQIQGSLPYVSPEQTGRVERILDSRSDLYSLGITFYEMLTGQRPFTMSDPLELIHAHLARSPKPPRELRPEIPEVLSEIILLLLKKDAGDRYQTAWGLLSDLETCRDQWLERGGIAPFELVREDISEAFKLPQKLYGRDEEIRKVHNVFESGAHPLLLITGYSGTGKTSLVHELHRPVTARQGHFVTGKHEQYQANTPYLGLGRALDELVGLLLATDPETSAFWRQRIGDALGQSGQVLVEIAPSLGRLLGEQPALPDTGLREKKNRFNFLLRRLLGVLASADHPLVMFLDDLQWADRSSLDFLIDLAIHSPPPFLLLVATYRSNEVDPGQDRKSVV